MTLGPKRKGLKAIESMTLNPKSDKPCFIFTTKIPLLINTKLSYLSKSLMESLSIQKDILLKMLTS